MRIAVVGSGVSGLGATWLLNEYSCHTVDLYEADSRPGGHANTVRYTPGGLSNQHGDESVYVDTGFIVFNPSTYPNFLRFLKMHSCVEKLVVPTEMTFSVSRDNGAFEWAGKNLLTIFCQPKNLLNPDMWRLIWDVARFNASAGRILLNPGLTSMSIGEYLEQGGYSASFKDNYLIPMTAAIWSTPPERCVMDFPATTLVEFMHNHHLLQITGKPSWLTIKGGSKAYVDQIISKLDKSRLHLSCPVASLTRLPMDAGGRREILLRTSNGGSAKYDHVILACHSDDARRILKNGAGIEGGEGISSSEDDILSMFKWNRNEAVLHSDVRLMPVNRSAWSCWNYLTRSCVDGGRRKPNVNEVTLTYGMNDLQHIPESRHGPVLVTLNPPFEPQNVVGRWKYDHPFLDHDAISAQSRLNEIQGLCGISFAGAYLRFGFHEDGFTSGLSAAAGLSCDGSVTPPFDIDYATKDIRRTTGLEFVAVLFDLAERSGIRLLVGIVGNFVLGLLRLLLAPTMRLENGPRDSKAMPSTQVHS